MPKVTSKSTHNDRSHGKFNVPSFDGIVNEQFGGSNNMNNNATTSNNAAAKNRQYYYGTTETVPMEITESIGIIGTWTSNEGTDMSKEINLVSWNNSKPKFDIRNWFLDGGDRRAGKGITLTYSEAKSLYKALEDYFENTEH